MKTLHNIEFYRFERKVLYTIESGEHIELTEECQEIISELSDTIKEAHNECFKALVEEYKQFRWNPAKVQHKIVIRFVRCNFGAIDNVQDIDSNGIFHCEHVECPLRGICHLEGVVCNPKKTTKLGARTYEVMELVFRGCEAPEIALKLGKSPETVRNQIFRGYHILGVNNRADFINYAHRNQLFKTEE